MSFRSRGTRAHRTHLDLERADLTALALRARDGDGAAEAAFVRRTMRDVWRYCAHVLGPGRADDATQATYLRALRSLGNFRGESAASTWLLGVARHVCLDEMRSSDRRGRLDAALRAQPVDVSTGFDGQPAELVEAVASLAPDRREAFVLTQVLGYSYEETAAVADCPIGTVRSRVARARADLIAHLDAGDEAAAGPAVRALGS